jgi:hypothetical protein
MNRGWRRDRMYPARREGDPVTVTISRDELLTTMSATGHERLLPITVLYRYLSVTESAARSRLMSGANCDAYPTKPAQNPI